MEYKNTSFKDLTRLDGKCAIITGGAQGIGAAIANIFVEAGASIIIADLNADTAQKQVQKIISSGGKAAFVKTDVSKISDIKNAVKFTIDTFGRVDILVNNAAIYPPSPVLETTVELWNQVMNINLFGSFFFAQEVAKWMTEHKQGGRIINIASVNAFKPGKIFVHYDTSKAAVVMLTKSMAVGLAPFGIQVNAIAPGVIETEGLNAAFAAFGSQVGPVRTGQLAYIPFHREGHPDEMARVALFLASELSSYLTGAVVLADGGSVLASSGFLNEETRPEQSGHLPLNV